MTPDPSGLICVGRIQAPHGVRGLVVVQSFTDDPETLFTFGDLWDAAGKRRFRVSKRNPHKGGFLAAVEGIEDRTAAETLKGVRLYVPRDTLPDLDDEDDFYIEDLVGLAVLDPDGRRLGRVKAVQNFGAGDVVEIALSGGTELWPFTKAVFPTVDVAAGHLIAVPPTYVEDWEQGSGSDPDAADKSDDPTDTEGGAGPAAADD